MKLEKLIINGYGRLTDTRITFKNGLNVIYGRNESGKTTIVEFIKAMLYGQRKGKTDGVTDKERYKPWNGIAYGGTLEYSLKNSERFRIWRDFNTGQVKLFDSQLNEVTHRFNQSRSGGLLFAQEHLGVDYELFVRTCFVGQTGVRLNEDGKSILAEKISDIAETGSERFSYAQSKKLLEKALQDEVGTDRTSGRPLNRVNGKIQEMELEKKRCKDVLKRVLELEGELKENREQEKRLAAEVDYIKALMEFNRLRDMNEEIANGSQGIKDLKRRIEERTEELEELNGNIPEGCAIFDDDVADNLLSMQERVKESNRRRILQAVWGLAVLAGVLAGIVKPLYWPYCLLLCLAGLTGVYLTRKSRTARLKDEIYEILTASGVDSIEKYFEKKKEIEYFYEKRELLMDSIKLIKEQIAAVSKKNIDTEEIEKELKQKNGQLGAILSQLTGYDDAGVFAELMHKSLEEINSFYKQKVDNLREKQLKLREIETEVRVLSEETEKLPSLEEELALAKLHRLELEEFGFCIRKALEVLNECSEKVRRNLKPRLAEKMSAAAGNLTGKYEQITAGIDDKGLMVSKEDGNMIPVSSLSGGTIDQVYLALRLAMTDLLSENMEPLPVILDEAFSQYDDDRIHLAANYLGSGSSDKQIILMTCSEYELNTIKNEASGSSIITLN